MAGHSLEDKVPQGWVNSACFDYLIIFHCLLGIRSHAYRCLAASVWWDIKSLELPDAQGATCGWVQHVTHTESRCNWENLNWSRGKTVHNKPSGRKTNWVHSRMPTASAEQISAKLTSSVWRGRMRPGRSKPKWGGFQEDEWIPTLSPLVWNLSLPLILSLIDGWPVPTLSTC